MDASRTPREKAGPPGRDGGVRGLAPLVRYFLPFLSGLHGLVLVGVASGIVAAVIETVGVSLVVALIYALVAGDVSALDGAGPLGHVADLVRATVGGSPVAIAAAVFVVIGAKAAVNYVSAVTGSRLSNGVSERVRIRIHDHLLTCRYAAVASKDYGTLLNVLATESWKVHGLYRALMRLSVCLAAAAVFLAAMLALSAPITLAAIAGYAVLFLATRRLERRAARNGGEAVVANRRLAERMVSVLRHLRSIRALGADEFERRRFREASAETVRTFLVMDRLNGLIGPLSEVSHLALMVGVIGLATVSGTPTGALLGIVALLHRLQPYLREVERLRIEFAGSRAALDEVVSLLSDADAVPPPDGRATFAGLSSAVELETVHFRYPGAAEPSLAAIDMRIAKGAKVGLVGASGAGKTTLVNLLLRLYEPTSGRILVDGAPLSGLSRASWAARVAIAGQDVDLVDGTVEENIRFGADGIDEADIRRAARVAGIAAFIERLPARYATPLDAVGLPLSGGQRQRIGLARALARRPDLLILDEATNAVDGETEEAIHREIRRAYPGVTLLVVAHRMAPVLDADVLVVLSEGRIAEAGPPADLLARDGSLFRTLFAA